MLTCTSERRNNKNKNKELMHLGLCASGLISPKRLEIFKFRYLFEVGQESRYQLVQTTSL